MEIGDVISRRDMPQFQFKIVGEAKGWRDSWEIKPLVKYRGFGSWRGSQMIDKNDERWQVVKGK